MSLQTHNWPERLLLAAGGSLFLALVLEWRPVSWSRPALSLQALALLVALLVARGHPPLRLIVYPLLLAGGIYLWDTSLPPPSLPEGPVRHVVPLILLLGLLIDCSITIRRSRRPSGYAPLFDGDQLPLTTAARILTSTPEAVRTRLRHLGRTTIIADDGTEYLVLDDISALIFRATLEEPPS
jgi:hypothetical protein